MPPHLYGETARNREAKNVKTPSLLLRGCAATDGSFVGRQLGKACSCPNSVSTAQIEPWCEKPAGGAANCTVLLGTPLAMADPRDMHVLTWLFGHAHMQHSKLSNIQPCILCNLSHCLGVNAHLVCAFNCIEAFRACSGSRSTRSQFS